MNYFFIGAQKNVTNSKKYVYVDECFMRAGHMYV